MPATRIDIVRFSLRDTLGQRQRRLGWLSDDEKQRAARYRFEKHRHRFIAGRGAIREILADRAGCSPEQIRFDSGEYGKPAIGSPEAARGIEFNATSSAEMGAIAISDGISLGCDIEKIDPEHQIDFDLIVDKEFCPAEKDWYSRQEHGDRPRVFFQLWTCKEAYLKALGVGLSGRLNSFSIDLTGAEPVVESTELEARGESRLRLRQFVLEDGYIASLALPVADGQVCWADWDAGRPEYGTD